MQTVDQVQELSYCTPKTISMLHHYKVKDAQAAVEMANEVSSDYQRQKLAMIAASRKRAKSKHTKYADQGDRVQLLRSFNNSKYS